VVPPIIGRTADEPVAAVVGKDHAVGFETFEDHSGTSGELRGVEVCLQSYMHAHRGKVLIFLWTGEVRGGRHIGASTLFHDKPKRVRELLRSANFIVASEAWQNG